MAPPTAVGADPAFAPSQPLLPSARFRSSVPLTSQRRPRQYDPRVTAPHRACASPDKADAVKAAKRVYKAAKAEYKARKAEYKALKAGLEMQQEPVVKDVRKSTPVAKPGAVDAPVVCEGKSCCRMGADAAAMLLGKQTPRAPCMKMCGGAGPSVRVNGNVVKIDLKKAVHDAVPPDFARSSPSPRVQANSVVELLGETFPASVA